MDFKKLWFWFSAVVAAGVIIFWIVGIDQFGFFTLNIYIYVALFLSVSAILVKLARKKVSPNYFLWFVSFTTAAIFLLIAALIELFIILTSGCTSFCGAFVAFFGPPGVISLVIAVILFIKSDRLS